MGEEGHFPGEFAQKVWSLKVGKADGKGAHQTAVAGYPSPMPLPGKGPGLFPIAGLCVGTKGRSYRGPHIFGIGLVPG